MESKGPVASSIVCSRPVAKFRMAAVHVRATGRHDFMCKKH